MRIGRLRGPGTVVLEDYSRRWYLFAFNWLLRLITRARLVCTVNGFYFSYRRSSLKNRLDRLVTVLFLRGADLIVFAGSAAVTELETFYRPRCQVAVVYPAVRRETTTAAPRRRRRADSTFRILFVGRFHPIKGLEHLVEALSLVQPHRIKLTVVADAGGYDPYRRSVMRLAQRRALERTIDFMGPVTDVHHLIEIYRSADVLAVPSLSESVSVVVREAMCLGVPLVGSSVGGILEAVQHGETGLLVPPGDPVSLAEAIRALADDPDLVTRLAGNALQASARYRDRTWEDVRREYRVLFHSYLDNRRTQEAEGA
jgi:glycosyltransferase involved in cell wall biosynthesis